MDPLVRRVAERRVMVSHHVTGVHSLYVSSCFPALEPVPSLRIPRRFREGVLTFGGPRGEQGRRGAGQTALQLARGGHERRMEG